MKTDAMIAEFVDEIIKEPWNPRRVFYDPGKNDLIDIRFMADCLQLEGYKSAKYFSVDYVNEMNIAVGTIFPWNEMERLICMRRLKTLNVLFDENESVFYLETLVRKLYGFWQRPRWLSTNLSTPKELLVFLEEEGFVRDRRNVLIDFEGEEAIERDRKDLCRIFRLFQIGLSPSEDDLWVLAKYGFEFWPFSSRIVHKGGKRVVRIWSEKYPLTKSPKSKDD